MKSDLLIEGISKIVSRFGMDQLNDSKKTLALLSDFIPTGKIEKSAMQRAYESGAMEILLTAKKSGGSADSAVLKARGVLVNNSLMDQGIAEQLVKDICTAIGLKISAGVFSGGTPKPSSNGVNNTTGSTSTSTKKPSSTANSSPKTNTGTAGTSKPKVTPAKPSTVINTTKTTGGTSTIGKSPSATSATTSSSSYPRTPKKSWSEEHKTDLIVAGSALGCVLLGVLISLGSWESGQWMVGISICAVLGGTLFIMYRNSDFDFFDFDYEYDYTVVNSIGMGLSAVNLLLLLFVTESYYIVGTFAAAALAICMAILSWGRMYTESSYFGAFSCSTATANLIVALTAHSFLTDSIFILLLYLLIWIGITWFVNIITQDISEIASVLCSTIAPAAVNILGMAFVPNYFQWFFGIMIAAISVMVLWYFASDDKHFACCTALGVITFANLLAMLFVSDGYSITGTLVAIGCLVASFPVAYYAYDDIEMGLGGTSAWFGSVSFVAALTAYNGIDNIPMWLLVFGPIAVVTGGIAIYHAINNYSGIVLCSVLNGIVLVAHLVTVFAFPDVYDSFGTSLSSNADTEDYEICCYSSLEEQFDSLYVLDEVEY